VVVIDYVKAIHAQQDEENGCGVGQTDVTKGTLMG
jgi:hypothetical protein